MKFQEITLDELKLVGFIDFDLKQSENLDKGLEFSSWDGNSDDICPYCGERHDLHTHNELNWEELYPTHSQLRENLPQLLKDDNIINKETKYEIIKFGNDINDTAPPYSFVGLVVKDLNKIPPNFVGMRYPKRRYKTVTITMEEYMNSKNIEEQLNSDTEIDDYFIIEYDLKNRLEFNKLPLKIYYPIKE